MKAILIEPTDTFFFRDSIPMSAGQGKGAGARLPWPSTLHEAVRASLFERYGRTDPDGAQFRKAGKDNKCVRFEDAEHVPAKGSADFQSLQLIGPFPVRIPSDDDDGEAGPEWFFPLPLDVVGDEQGRPHTLMLLRLPQGSHSGALPMLAVSPVPAGKNTPSGFLGHHDYERYLRGDLDSLLVQESTRFFEPEYRIGVEIDPVASSAAHGQLYAATHARSEERFRFGAWIGLKRPVNREEKKLEELEFLLLGGERRLARIHREKSAPPSLPALPAIKDVSGPVLLKWILVTPAVFANGWLPGWCRDTQGNRPDGEVCLKLDEGRAHLVATALGRLQAFAGWDTLESRAKPTLLAVPAGSVYYFLCDNPATARELATLLHWRPRSDAFGEKGFGYGLVSEQVPLHPTSADVSPLATALFAG